MLPRRRRPDRLPQVMDADQASRNERIAHTASSSLSGFIVALMAIAGADCALSAPSTAWRVQSSTPIVARTIIPPPPIVFSSRGCLSWVFVALLAFFLFRAMSTMTGQWTETAAATRQAPGSSVVRFLLRRFSISWRSGGLYGP